MLRHERVAVTTESLLSRTARLPAEQRHAVRWYLATASPVLAYWVRWNRWFPAMFTIGVLEQFCALLALAFGLPVTAYAFVLTGLLPLAVAAVRLWRISLQALDIAVGACLPNRTDDRCPTRSPSRT